MYRKDNFLKCLVLKLILLVLAILLLVSTSCHFSPTIYLDGGNPPRFHFEGRDYVEFFVVTEIAPENQNVPDVEQDTDKNKILWWIVPKDTSTANVRNFPQITYGVLPPNFVRKVPAQGDPPPLEEGKVYEAGGPAISLPKGYLRFVIRNGEAVQVRIPTR
jgi:hypothetical protein